LGFAANNDWRIVSLASKAWVPVDDVFACRLCSAVDLDNKQPCLAR
jgi:hypothetical protein